jgi:hypothetical protein
MITVSDETREELLHSKSFLKWSPGPKPSGPQSIIVGRGREFIYQGETHTNLIVDEKHYAPADLAKAWGVSAETVRLTFREEPGVLRLRQPTTGKRSYVLLRIPHSVAERVHRRLSAVPQ